METIRMNSVLNDLNKNNLYSRSPMRIYDASVFFN